MSNESRPLDATLLKRRAKLLIAWPVVAVLGVFYTLLHPMGEYRMTMRSFMEDWKTEWRDV